MTTHELVFVGAGGLAREAVMASAHLRPIGFVDDDATLVGADISGLRVLGTVDHLVHLDSRVSICVGSGESRRSLAHRLSELGVTSDRFTTLIHPTVSIPSTSQPGLGSVLLAGVVLTTDVWMGHHVVVMPNAVLTHDDSIGDFATICAGVALGGNVTIGSAAYLGMNCCVRENVTIGAGAVIGMGSVVLEDVPPGETWVGVPARPLRSRTTAARGD